LRIRSGRAEDIPAICEIEVAGGALFAAIGMDSEVLLTPPPDLAETRGEEIHDGRLWVAVDDGDRPVAFLVLAIVDGNAHVEQVSVDPDHARRGIGGELIEHAVAWARERGLPAMTLTTYADVAWNAPYYERCGFRRMTDSELTPGLRAIRALEAASGLDEWARLGMTRQL
jgi:GNAT superfamily N-acetyltransferase